MCILCHRRFKAIENLEKHCILSDIHLTNIKKYQVQNQPIEKEKPKKKRKRHSKLGGEFKSPSKVRKHTENTDVSTTRKDETIIEENIQVDPPKDPPVNTQENIQVDPPKPIENKPISMFDTDTN